MMEKVMVVKVNQRNSEAPHLQEILTKYGCNIKIRLGLHETGDFCSNKGVIILQTVGEEDLLKVLEDEISAMEGVSVTAVEI